ncbi:hypothetical protein PCANC_14649 [Puccinia coronata f. sp. avenae]|uniref:Uncharacterized protein n=1 Tax=Puccinia coronata f. sp. avenae TaxID=200324 RepID=A0A2N5SVY2_9BASI|nr:hypothetical protein PCANC_14649 [Puccinia coronata f. sp. avenae]
MAEPHIDPAIFFSDHISTENNKPPPKMISTTTQPAVIKPYIGQKEEAESSPLTNVLHRTSVAERCAALVAERCAASFSDRCAASVRRRKLSTDRCSTLVRSREL